MTSIACSRCPLTLTETDLGYACECGYRDDVCAKCHQSMTWAPDHRGTTCGGLDLVGACACVPCGVYELCRKSRPADAVEWRLAKGGRSLTAGGIKVRAESGADADDVVALMQRIVRLPDLELEIERLRAVLARRAPATDTKEP